MSGKKESMLERILRPVRVHPGTIPAIPALATAAFMAHYYVGQAYQHLVSNGFSVKDPDVMTAAGINAALFGLGVGIITAIYKRGMDRYLKDKKIIRKHGFDERHARLRMRTYCGRQSLYVASVEAGYREEFARVDAMVPPDKKAFNWLPQI